MCEVDQVDEKDERPVAGQAVSHAAVDWLGVEAGGGDEGPKRSEEVRTLLMPLVFLAAGIAALVKGWLVAGIVLLVLGVGMLVFQIVLGALFVKYVLRKGANVFRLLAVLMQPDVAHRGVGPAANAAAGVNDHEAQVDAAVGFGLTRAAAEGGFFCAGMDPDLVQARRANVLEERAATYAWLQEGPGWVEVHTAAPDGVDLVGHAWVCDAASTRWAVLCHGYAGTWDSMLQYTRHWAQAGYNLLVVEMRCHGASAGKLIGMGVLDGPDVVAWARRLEAGLPGMPAARDVVLMGHSMGGHAVLVAAGDEGLPSCVRAVVADCPFDRAWSSFAHMLDSAGLPVHPTLEIVRRHLRLIPGGYDIVPDDAAQSVARAKVGVLLVHGTLDSSVAPACTRRLYEAGGPGKRDVLLVEGAGHCQASLVAPNAYWSRVLGFAEACVR